MALGSRVGSLYVRVGADTRDFHRQMDRANRPLERFRVAAGAAVKAFAVVGAAAAAASVGIYALARSEMNLIDEQAKLARSIGGTVTGLRTLRLAAEDNGIDGLEGSLNRLNRRLGAVEMGGGPAAETVKRLGLNIKELSEMDIDDRLAAIADTIHESGMSAQEAARHLQQLGFQQQEATTFFMQGGEAIRAARGEIEDYGLAVSMLDAAKMEEANTQMSRMSLIVQGLRTQLAVALAPTLLEISQRLASVARAVMATIIRVDTLGDAADDLGGNQSIVNFARSTGLAIARLVDFVALLRNALNAFEGYAKAWAISTVRTIATPFEGLVRIGAKFNEDMFADQVAFFDNLERLQDEGWEQGKQGWNDFWTHIRDGQGRAVALFKESWDQEVPPIVVRPDREIPGVPGAGPGGKDDGAAKRELEENQRRLEALQQFLAGRDEIEMLASAKRLSDLDAVRAAGLISEEKHLEMLAGLAANHFETMAGLQDENHREKLEKLAELHDLELLGLQEYTERQLEQLQAHEDAQTELALDAYEARKEILDELREMSEMDDEEYRERMREAEQQLQDDLTLIAARGAKDRNAVSTQEANERSRVMSGMMGNLTQLMNSGSKEMFRIGKIAAIAQALLSGREAVVSSYKVGARIGGPALGAAFAATAAAATAAQIASVKNTSFGGGGGVSGGGGGYSRPTDAIAEPPVAAEAPAQHTAVTINLTGEIFNRQQIREIIEQINEATGDGAVLRLN